MIKLIKHVVFALMMMSSIQASAVDYQNDLWAGQILNPGDRLFSNDGNYYLTQQSDGNLVVYRSAGPVAIWATYKNGTHTLMQSDGNLVQYSGTTPVWSSGTGGRTLDSNYKLSVLFSARLQITLGQNVIWTGGAQDEQLAPCPNGAPRTLYPICLQVPGGQINSVVPACSVSEASMYASANNGYYGACR